MRTKTEQDRREGNSLEVAEFFLKPGYILANPQDTVIRSVAGNSVVVTLFDRDNGFGGINHYVLPATRERKMATPQYGNVAVSALCRLMFELGCRSRHLEAQIMGGASHKENPDDGLGLDNVRVARHMLKKYRIPIVSEDIGGFMGRKIIFHSGTNETIIYKVDKIRESDWFGMDSDLRFN